MPFCSFVSVSLPAGIDRSRVEDMESRLKADVLREAARYDQHILVTEEDDDMNVSLMMRHACVVGLYVGLPGSSWVTPELKA